MIGIFKIIKSFAPWLFAIWLILIIVFSSLPKLPEAKISSGEIEIRIDYLLHFAEYLTLAFLSILTFTPDSTSFSGTRIKLIFIFLLVFAIIDESHQLLIPGRSFNYIDIISNILGIFIGLLVSLWLNRRIN